MLGSLLFMSRGLTIAPGGGIRGASGNTWDADGLSTGGRRPGRVNG